MDTVDRSVPSQSYSAHIPDPTLDGIEDFDSLRENVNGKLNLDHWMVLPSQRTLHIFSLNKKLNGNLSIRNTICIDVDLIVKVFGANDDDMLFSLRLYSWPQLQTLVEQCGAHVKREVNLEFVDVVDTTVKFETNGCEDKDQKMDILAFGKTEVSDFHQPLADLIENSMSQTESLEHSNTSLHKPPLVYFKDDGAQSNEFLVSTANEISTQQLQMCTICNETCGISEMARHLQHHFNGESYQCHICGRDFQNFISLQRHAKSNHTTGREEFFCDLCKVIRDFGTKEILEQHMKNRHVTKKTLVFNCSTCGKEFFTRKQFTAHVGRHDRSKWKSCPICNKKYDNVKRHVNTKHLNIKSHICDICGSAYKQWTSLKEHIEIRHSPSQEFFCGICQDGRDFRSKAYLKRHFAKMHSKDGPRKPPCQPRQTSISKPFHECKFCNERFPSGYALKNHVVLQHNRKLPPFPCKTCDKTFTSKNTLTEHLKLHAGEVHICHECGQSFTHKNYLTKHLIRHQKRKRKCTMCEKQYANNIDLRMHMKKVHNVFVPPGLPKKL